MFEKVRRQRRSSATMLGGLAVIVALTGVVAGGAQAANPGNSQNAKACQKGGWEDLARSEDHSGFSSKGECVTYAAQGGTLVNPLALCEQQLADAGLTEPASANYILGTPGDDHFTAQMTAGNDLVCGFGGFDEIRGLGIPAHANGPLLAGDIFLGGDGPDVVFDLDGGTFEGGPGDDEVEFLDSGTFEGGAGDDHVGVIDGGTFNGGAGNDSVDAMFGGTFNGDDGYDVVSVRNCGGTLNGVEEAAICDYEDQ